jgi:hypothetical protein
MNAHRATNGRGTLLLDRIFSGVGRIRVASGTNDLRTFKGINAMLTDFYDKGRFDLLEAIRDKRMTPARCYSLSRGGELRAVTDPAQLEPLTPRWRAWVAQTDMKETRMGREYAWKRMVKALPLDASPYHLPKAVRRMRETLADQPAAFNRTRAAVLAFLRDTFGKRDELYLSVTDIPVLKEVKHKRPAPTVSKAIEVRDALPRPAAALWWALYTTGMGRGEIDGLWEVLPLHVAIHGTKRETRNRIVPRIGTPQPRAIGWKQFRLALLPFGLQPYDARRGFAHLMEESGVTRIRRMMYMGHAAGDVTGGYEKAELGAFVESDAALMRAKIDAVEAERYAAVKAGMMTA